MLEHAPLEAVYIYFDTATYDEIERDEKVIFCQDMSGLLFVFVFVEPKFFGTMNSKKRYYMLLEGDNGSPIRLDRRHHGPSNWFLHPKWSRNHLLHSKVFF